MAETTADVRRDIAETRANISDTVSQIEERVAGRVGALKERLDVMGLVERHPWPVLAAALAIGYTLAASGADRKAASATVGAVKRAPRAAKGKFDSWRERRHEASLEKAAYESDEAPSRPGVIGRMKERVASRVRGGVDEVVGEMQEAADELAPAQPAVQVESLYHGAWTNVSTGDATAAATGGESDEAARRGKAADAPRRSPWPNV